MFYYAVYRGGEKNALLLFFLVRKNNSAYTLYWFYRDFLKIAAPRCFFSFKLEIQRKKREREPPDVYSPTKLFERARGSCCWYI